MGSSPTTPAIIMSEQIEMFDEFDPRTLQEELFPEGYCARCKKLTGHWGWRKHIFYKPKKEGIPDFVKGHFCGICWDVLWKLYNASIDADYAEEMGKEVA